MIKKIQKFNDKCNLILISSGTQTMAKAFKLEYIPEDSKVSLYLDEDFKIYKFFKCPQEGVWNFVKNLPR